MYYETYILWFSALLDLILYTVQNYLQNIVGLVTGGASGLGRATVERLVRQGGRAVICDLQTSKGHEVAKEFGDSAVFVPTDVS